MEIVMSSGNYKIIDSGQVFLFGLDDELRMDSPSIHQVHMQFFPLLFRTKVL